MVERIYQFDSFGWKVKAVYLKWSREDGMVLFLKIGHELRNFQREKEEAKEVHIWNLRADVTDRAQLFWFKLGVLPQKIINFVHLSRVDNQPKSTVPGLFLGKRVINTKTIRQLEVSVWNRCDFAKLIS